MKECPVQVRHCDTGTARTSSSIIFIGCFLMACVLTLSIFIMAKFKNLKKDELIEKHFLATSYIILFATTRLIWWCMNITTYEAYSAAGIINKMLNRCAMLFLYLAQSYYSRTWLSLFIILNGQRWNSQLNFVLSIIDVIISILLTVTIICCAIPQEETANFQDYAAEIITIASLLTIILFIIIGAIIIRKVGQFYGPCSRQKRPFIVFTFLLILPSILRVLTLFYDAMTGEKMNSNFFMMFFYLVPDIFPVIVISADQLKQFLEKQKKQEEEYLLETTTKEFEWFV
ncbi:Conserved_hypothetical protein [Hexamita inflata]|uniref:Uncharacterized protein n=1 Tax=Hexamita inflata TaxID=28002 RepID=A0AA86NYY3_9EUKA|nr:Conserved hypothetical protein [Hexamita inflata]